MLKANSLLYAIYICVVVAILCNMMIYLATIYDQINLIYNQKSRLLLEHQSFINNTLSSNQISVEENHESSNFCKSEAIWENFGVLQLLHTTTYTTTDTLSSSHFIGIDNPLTLSLFVPDFSQQLTYSGTVVIEGDYTTPTAKFIQKQGARNTQPIQIIGQWQGKQEDLPTLSPIYHRLSYLDYSSYSKKSITTVQNQELQISYQSEGTHYTVMDSDIQNSKLHGKIVLYNKDSLVVSSNNRHEDVVLISPKIVINDYYRGSIQCFATEKISIGEHVILDYPSVLMIRNSTFNESFIQVGKNSTVRGSVLLYGVPSFTVDKNKIELLTGSSIQGVVYNEGMTMSNGTIEGTLYSKKLYYRDLDRIDFHLLQDTNISSLKLSPYFIHNQHFNDKKYTKYIQKRVF